MAQAPKVMFVRAGFPFNYDVRAAGKAGALVCPGKGRTQQQFKGDSDINVIVKRFRLTGQLPVNVRVPTFGDFTQVTDFKTAMDALASARDSFMEMPADVRRRFDNDPQAFVEFCSKPENLAEMRKMGLAVAKAADGSLSVDNKLAEPAKAAAVTPAPSTTP